MVGMCVGYVLCDRIAEGNMLFRSVTTNTFLIGACLLAETAFFIFMFVSILVLGLHSTMAINVISLGAGAVVTTYILGLLGCVVGVVSVANSETWTIVLTCLCVVAFLIVHSLDHASINLFANTNVLFGLCLRATNVHALHVAICGFLITTALASNPANISAAHNNLMVLAAVL